MVEFFEKLPTEEETKEEIMTWADEWRKEGKKLMAVDMTQNLLKEKFGDVSDNTRQSLQECTVEQLNIIAKRILSKDSLKAVFEGIR